MTLVNPIALGGPPDDQDLIERLRDGEQDAFVRLVEAMTPAMRRVARTHLSSAEVADEVVQDTWLGVLNGLDAFEGRASFKTWIFSILVNLARTRGVLEHRMVPFATLAARESVTPSAAVGAERFLSSDHDRWPNHWAAPPRRWELSPEAALSHAGTLETVRAGIRELPPIQRIVIVMRDLEGFSSDEVCEVLDLTASDQRVLLHRARSGIRAGLEEYLAV